MNRRELELAALATADPCLQARGYVAFDEVFREMGKLGATQWDEWRRGPVPYLERLIRLNLSLINAVCRAVQASTDFDRRLAEIRAAHAKKRSFIEQLIEQGL